MDYIVTERYENISFFVKKCIFSKNKLFLNIYYGKMINREYQEGENNMDHKIFLVSILACFILSTTIGIERQLRHRMVGLRTNVLVSLGAFMFMCISFGTNTPDETRIAAQVVSGIGFLGAGVILRDGNKIKGLNTAATLWCVAAIGVLTAAGMIIEASVCTVLVLFSNILLRLISQKIMNKSNQKQKEECLISILCDKTKDTAIRLMITKLINKNNLSLESLEKSEISQNEISLVFKIKTFRLDIIQEIINKISCEAGINSVSLIHEKYIKMDNEDTDEEITEVI